MSEPILNALVQLFALISDIHEDTVISSREKNIVRAFLARHLNNELVEKYMALFEDQLNLFISERLTKDSIQDRKRTTLNAMRILAICEKINQELRQHQKIYVLVQLIDYISLGSEITTNELDFLQSVSDAFHVPSGEYSNIRSFIMEAVREVPEKRRVLVIDSNMEPTVPGIRHLCEENLKGSLSFLHIPGTNTYILRYSGNEDLYLNGQNIFAGQTYIFDHGSSVRGKVIKTIYYTEIVALITETTAGKKVRIDATDVTFRFRNSENGIHGLNFHEESGRLVGILGGSGVGKSTTLSILNGTLKPQAGTVYINGYDLYNEDERGKIKGTIGFVPQDDLLIEELTVYQNLYFNAKLCMNHLAEEKIVEVVNRTLSDFDLEGTRDLKVGSPLKKVISGGQRKRLNIALELMREPSLLFVDEPTSGLSSVDSETVMNLLKAQTFKGRLVIINIHQPGSDIYKMFDKIMIIDKGGYQVYYGNPTEAIVYFRKHSGHANADEDQCIQCGNVDTDQLLQIIESRVVDERGRPTRMRKVSPKEWAERFRESGMIKERNGKEKQSLPESNFSIPGLLKQSVIFFRRDLLSKLADRQYIIISLLGPPLLALLLAYFTKYSKDGIYRFSENENIIPYIFMCVVTSLFFGLMISSEEIIRDRKLLKREAFLNLSWFSYLNSKIMILFIVSAIQTISFVLIGNTILGIRGMTFAYWLVLFTTSCAGNILGLNLSSAFNSVVTVYIIIPFIVIPQLLFSGVLVPYNKLHIGDSGPREYVPVIGDLMVARWSFEAITLKQFRDNDYEKSFFEHEMKNAENDWYINLTEKLITNIAFCSENRNSSEYRGGASRRIKMVYRHLDELSGVAGKQMPLNISDDIDKLDSAMTALYEDYSDSLRRHFSLLRNKYLAEKDKIEDQMIAEMGGQEQLNLLESRYVNTELKNRLSSNLIGKELTAEINYRIIPRNSPGYMAGRSAYGRAHFYAPYKYIGTLRIDTYKFNLLVIWLATLLLYAALCYRLLQRAISSIESLKLPKAEA